MILIKMDKCEGETKDRRTLRMFQNSNKSSANKSIILKIFVELITKKTYKQKTSVINSINWRYWYAEASNWMNIKNTSTLQQLKA